MRTKRIGKELFRQLLLREALFWSKVKKGTPDECWPWMASCSEEGYGQIAFNWKGHHRFKSPRLAWMLNHQKLVPKSFYVLHNCSNPKCCNPNHLRIGNQSENIQQMVNEERGPHGETQHNAKLKTHQVIKIRLLVRSKKYLMKDLAQIFQVSVATISLIAGRKSWRHLHP